MEEYFTGFKRLFLPMFFVKISEGIYHCKHYTNLRVYKET